MKAVPIKDSLLLQTTKALAQSPLFKTLSKKQVAQVVARSELLQYEDGEIIMEEGSTSLDLQVILKGDASVRIPSASGGDMTEVCVLSTSECVGEMGLLRESPRSATVVAQNGLVAVRISADIFYAMFDKIEGFGLSVCRALADRLHRSSRTVPMSSHETSPPSADVLAMLPIELMQRYRVLPLAMSGNTLTLGFVEDPNARVLSGVKQLLPSFEIKPVSIDLALFDSTLATQSGLAGWTTPAASEAPPSEAPAETSAVPASSEATGSSPQLDQLLKRMVAEAASDLHLSGGQKPRWRIDGRIVTLEAQILGDSQVYELLDPVMTERNRAEFLRDNDTDFAYQIPGLARFRVNLFRDRGGVGAVLRVIPDKILTVEQLGLSETILRFCEVPKGLIVVTGPTGSGKSTTLAAMLDHINKTRSEHVITLEDPIEFVHPSRSCLINHREIGRHSTSFNRALRAALRQDPDIVLVGEMRDLETVKLAMETANTGHLVFGTLHTATAVSTIERIISIFPSSEWDQVRGSLADCLKGVVAQCLCRRIGGGRVAAMETLVVNYAMTNMIRTDKAHQIPSAMSTGIKEGNLLLNQDLAQLVGDGKVDFEEAMSKSLDRPDLAQRCGMAYP